MYNIVLVTGFVDSKFKYREEIYYNYFSKKKYNIFLFSSYFSPPQKNNQKIYHLIGNNHFRVKSIFKIKDIVVFPMYSRLKAIKPDLLHLFDAQQLVGLIPFLYCKIHNIPFIYEHELRIIPKSILGKIRFYLLIKPLIKLYSKNAILIRTVTPAGTSLLLNCFNNNEIIKNKIIESTLSFSKTDDLELYIGYKPNARIINLAFSGKIDNVKFDLLIIFLNLLPSNLNSNIIFHFILDLTKKQIEKVNSIINKKCNFEAIYHGLLPRDKYLNLLIKLDGALFVAPTISYFEAIGCNLPIFINSDESSDHLNSRNIFKYKYDSLSNDFIIFLNSIKSFYYSSDDCFSEENVVKKLEEQYLSILNKN